MTHTFLIDCAAEGCQILLTCITDMNTFRGSYGSTEVIMSNSFRSGEKMVVHIVFMLRRILGTCITQYYTPFLKAMRKWLGGS